MYWATQRASRVRGTFGPVYNSSNVDRHLLRQKGDGETRDACQVYRVYQRERTYRREQMVTSSCVAWSP